MFLKNEPSKTINSESRISKGNTLGGFTIIEVLFVLAIAGLIFLIILQSIPALTRSSRNNQRKQDVASILGAVSHYELNNSGTFPSNCGSAGHPLCNASGQPLHNVQFTYYDSGITGNIIIVPQSRTISPVAVDIPALSGSNADQKVQIYNYEKCDTVNGGAATINGAGYNDVVALYALEAGGSGISTQCEQL